MTNKVKGAVGAHPVLAGLGVLVLVCAGVGAFVYNQMFGLQTTVVYFGVPDAPTLTAKPDETLYRIDATKSKITYNVDEKLAGTTHTATGTTRGIAGDIALNTNNPTTSRVGDIVCRAPLSLGMLVSLMVGTGFGRGGGLGVMGGGGRWGGVSRR